MGRILIADDDAGVRKFLRAALESLPGNNEILEAEDGREVIRIVEGTPVDLVITDLCMPDQDGIETILALRRGWIGIKILAISGAYEGLLLKQQRRWVPMQSWESRLPRLHSGRPSRAC
jgi:CheY-like chemotaxis protein